MTWQTVIRHYKIKHLPNHRSEKKWFSGQRTLADAIEKAALAENEGGKRYAHQRRIPQQSLRKAFKGLSCREKEMGLCASFDELLSLIEDAVCDVPGIGELYCYDTALRIGAKLSLRPDKVFLHAGTRVGASIIAGTRGRKWLTKQELPPELHSLPAEQIEDILCIYKDRIERLRNNPLQRTADSRR